MLLRRVTPPGPEGGGTIPRSAAAIAPIAPQKVRIVGSVRSSPPASWVAASHQFFGGWPGGCHRWRNQKSFWRRSARLRAGGFENVMRRWVPRRSRKSVKAVKAVKAVS